MPRSIKSLSELGKLRADRLLTNLGFCTRSSAFQWAKTHKFTVNGLPLKKAGEYVDPEEVRIDGEKIPYGYKPLTILLHKPLSFVCSRKSEAGSSVIYELLPPSFYHRHPILSVCGRLDKYASGLVCLSQEGIITEALSRPLFPSQIPSLPSLLSAFEERKEKLEEGRVEERKREERVDGPTLDKLMGQVLETMAASGKGKTYEIFGALPFTEMDRRLFASGCLRLSGEGKALLPAELKIDKENPHKSHLTLYEGRYHQIRRMLASIHNKAESIHRIQIGNFSLSGLEVGEWRILTEEEKESLLSNLLTEDEREREREGERDQRGRERRRRKLKDINRFSRESQQKEHFIPDDDPHLGV